MQRFHASAIKFFFISFYIIILGFGLISCGQQAKEDHKQELKKVLDDGREFVLEKPRRSYELFDSGYRMAREYRDSIYMALFQISRGVAMYHLGEFDKSLADFKKGYRLSKKGYPDSLNMRSKAANNIAVIHDKRGQRDSAQKYYEEALRQLAEREDVNKEKGAIWMNLGNLCQSKDDYQIAINKYLKALEFFQKADGTPFNRLKTFENIGIAYIKLSSPELGLEYLQKALSDTAGTIPTELKANVFGNMAEAYHDMDSLTKARQYNQKALTLSESLSDAYGIYNAKKRRIRIALAKGEPRKALQYINDLKQTAFYKDNKKESSHLALLACKSYNNAGNHRKALKFCRDGLEKARQKKDSSQIRMAYDQMAAIYENLGMLDSAVWAYKQTQVLQEESLRAQKQDYVKGLRSHMAFEKQQQRIKLLKQQNEIKTLKARRQQTWIIMLGGGLVLLLVASGFLVKLNQKRKQANRSLEQQKQVVQQQNEALQAANEEVRKASKAQADFIAMVSHEIRTPINGVMGMTELLQETKLDEQQRSYLQSIRSSSNALLTVINDVLELNQQEQGRLVIHPQLFDLQDMIRDVKALLQPAIEQNGLAFYLNVANELPANLYGDSDRIRQMLINLISNAMKFTQEGYIKLAVESEGPSAKNDGVLWVAFHVSDTGMGIDQETQQRIFEAFEQGDNEKQVADGVGLGLAICQILSSKMNGRVDLESEPDKGSVFTIRLPLMIEAPESGGVCMVPDKQSVLDENDKKPGERCPMNILLAEDDQLNQEVATRFLERLGYEPLVVSDGQAVIDKVQEGYVPDLVLMDIKMPRKDGVAAAQELRQIFPPGKRPVVVALTADAMAGASDQYLNAGMDDYLTKPFNFQQLRNLIQRWSTHVLE